jgi:hypothetical protein
VMKKNSTTLYVFFIVLYNGRDSNGAYLGRSRARQLQRQGRRAEPRRAAPARCWGSASVGFR